MRTRDRLAALRWSWHEQPALWDVDRPADFERLAASELMPGIAAIREFFNAFDRPELANQSGEITSLEQWLENLRHNREKREAKPEPEPPQLSERQKLERALQDAVSREDYEQAARVRDALKNLKA